VAARRLVADRLVMNNFAENLRSAGLVDDLLKGPTGKILKREIEIPESALGRTTEPTTRPAGSRPRRRA
jgi:hypothetical protein